MSNKGTGTAVADMAEGALMWSEEEASGVLNSHDKDVLRTLASNSNSMTRRMQYGWSLW